MFVLVVASVMTVMPMLVSVVMNQKAADASHSERFAAPVIAFRSRGAAWHGSVPNLMLTVGGHKISSGVSHDRLANMLRPV
ncbi:hypothetical protein RRG08_049879 [Elysia crispata]|uniref:Uncharacterized protein n=1 Tax=Elysia crispata TaxID=231223 RepID=A0AAE0XZP4_9GAST|nr:hypothetical protein RRG08_049879 [Elysia crispata]